MSKKYKKKSGKKQVSKTVLSSQTQGASVSDFAPLSGKAGLQAAPKPSVPEKKKPNRNGNQLPSDIEVYTGLNINFIGKSKIYYAISITLIVVGILISVIFGVNLDIQFKGGTIIQYSYSGNVNKDTAQSVAEKSLPKTNITTSFDKVSASNTQMISYSFDKSVSESEQQTLVSNLQKQFPGNNIKEYESNTVSPEMGREFFMKSIFAVALASVLIILYIWFRFRNIGGLPAGVTAFVALIHDVLMAFVAFSIFRIPINDNFVAVALTILGYSINDTIVVYDRIRENRKIFGTRLEFRHIVNKSINQSFARSINTTLVTFMAIAVVCAFSIVFHIDSIRNFALPMMVGVVTGCYSTICIAGPLWVTWVEHKEKKAGKIVTKAA